MSELLLAGVDEAGRGPLAPIPSLRVAPASRSGPIDDADVFNMRTNNHTHSDEKGAFTLADAAIGDTLNIIHYNYKNVKVVNNGN